MVQVRTEDYSNSHKDVEVKSKWWLRDEKELHLHVHSVVRQIEQNQDWRYERDLDFARLYGNKEILGLMATQFNRSLDGLDNRVSLNLAKAAIDTWVAKLCADKPRAMFLTDEGNWEMRRRAERLTRYMDGLFDENEIYTEAGPDTLRDNGVFGIGVFKIFRGGPGSDKVKIEQVPEFEIIVDEIEGIYRKPRQIHQKRYLFKEVLKDMFPGKEHKELRRLIDDCNNIEGTSESSADMIPVIESWHLRSGKDAKDGCWAMSIPTATLFKKEWTKDYFPFVFRRRSRQVLGFYGMGICEELAGLQIEINKLLRRIQDAMHLFSVPKVWVEEMSEISKNNLNNILGGIGKYKGKPPVVTTAQAMHPEVYNHIWTLWQKGFEQIGLSELSATSRKPAGVTANVALQTLQDIESERFMREVDDNQRAYLQVSYIAIDLTRDIAEEKKEKGEDMAVKTKWRSFMEEIKWSEVAIDRDKYITRAHATNLLPTHPAARLQKIQEMVAEGSLSKEEGIALMDFPDIQEVTALKRAPREIVEKIIDRILDGKKADRPEPEFPLELAKQMAHFHYLKAKMGGAPDDVLEELRNFRQQCKDLIDKAKEAEAQAMIAEQAAVVGQGQLPPPEAAIPQGAA